MKTMPEQFLGSEVNLFSSAGSEAGHLGTGFLVGQSTDGFLLLAETEGGEPDLAIALSQVAMLAVVTDKERTLKPLSGGKALRFPRPDEDPRD